MDTCNNGLGPAFIDRFEVVVGDQTFVPRDYREVLEAVAPFMAESSIIQDKCYAVVVRTGHVMGKDSHIKIGALVFRDPSQEELQKLHSGVHFVVHYHSAYNEKISFDTREN